MNLHHQRNDKRTTKGREGKERKTGRKRKGQKEERKLPHGRKKEKPTPTRRLLGNLTLRRVDECRQILKSRFAMRWWWRR